MNPGFHIAQSFADQGFHRKNIQDENMKFPKFSFHEITRQIFCQTKNYQFVLIISVYLIQTEFLFTLSLLYYQEAFLTLWQTSLSTQIALPQWI